jgi:hypothetical protein
MPMTDQLAALQRIAQFSASVRGHELGRWLTGEGFAQARCTRCGRTLRVYRSLIQPEMDGAALDDECGSGAALRAA